MSRVANSPVVLPSGVEVKLNDDVVAVKGAKGALEMPITPTVKITEEDGKLLFAAGGKDSHARAMSGTVRSLVNNMVVGVSTGFEKKLQLNGVGYRAKASGSTLNLVLGFSHPVDYALPDGVKAETPSQTEIVLTSIDKQKLGQCAAEIRAFRPPEPYKGKGIRYADEYVRRKEAKKK